MTARAICRIFADKMQAAVSISLLDTQRSGVAEGHRAP